MSNWSSRTYSRKKASQPISQFDKLLSEPGSSDKPSAAKTAGHIGKWGDTRFTSIRNINGAIGNDISLKRGRKSPPSSCSDIFSDETGHTNVTKPVATYKPRKFFKSRGSDLPTNGSVDSVISSDSKVASDEIVKSGSSETESSKSVPVTNIESSRLSPKPGIKLKIFKNRNGESSTKGTYFSTVEIPSDSSKGDLSSSPAKPHCEVDDLFTSLTTSSLETSTPHVSSSPKSFHTHVNAPLPTSSETLTDCPFERNSPDIAGNSAFDSSLEFEFGALVDDKTGLPVGIQEPAETSAGIKNDALYSGVSEKLPEFISNNDPSYPVDKLSHSSDCNFFPQTQSASSLDVASSVQSSESSGLNLFSSDFDENEIVDRTKIDYSHLEEGEDKISCSGSEDLDERKCLGNEDTDYLSSQGSVKKDTEVTSCQEGANVLGPPANAKKRSIFKSRSAFPDSRKRATYHHKWHSNEEKEEKKRGETKVPKSSGQELGAFDFDDVPALRRVQTWPSQKSADSDADDEPITSVKCIKGMRQFYTVVRNVKKTHQLQESGEFQEFNDDVDYFLDALRDVNAMSTRCLAAVNLVQKCMIPSFRMHLRAHGTVIKFFSALSDAPNNPKLGLCVSMVMFALSQDHLNMDLDRNSLELMLTLLDMDEETASGVADSVQDEQYKRKIRDLCMEMQKRGHAKHVDLNNITAGLLAMETLLSLTSKRTGEWFKEELRNLGGIDHLIHTVTNCSQNLTLVEQWTHTLLENISKVDRCLKVIENITHQNIANQEHMLTFEGGVFYKTLISLFDMCRHQVPLYSSVAVSRQPQLGGTSMFEIIFQVLLSVMKVFMNLTHSSGKEALGSKILGHRDEVYEITLYCLLVMPNYLEHDKKFEMLVLACCLLLNLAENSKHNRKKLMLVEGPSILKNQSSFGAKKRSAMECLTDLFYTYERSAKEQEAHTDQIIDHDLDLQVNAEERKDDEIEETVTKVLQRAGRNMEDTFVAACPALLTGYCVMDNKEYELRIRAMQPEGHFKTMVAVLKKFMGFMNLTATTSLLRAMAPTERVIRYMEDLDKSGQDTKAAQDMDDSQDLCSMDSFGF